MACRPLRFSSVLTTTLSIYLVLLALCPQWTLADSWQSGDTTAQFQDWYPQFGYIFREILAQNCTQQYANYLTGVKDTDKIDWLGGGDHASALTQPLVQCLLDHTSDYVKSAMSSAQVLLGVTPTILAVLGSSSTELALLNIVGRRPMLGLLLTLGAPSVFMSRAFDFTDPAQLLQNRRGRLRQKAWEGWKLQLVMVAEYAVALAAIANVATLNWNLGLRTVCWIWSNSVSAPILWSALIVIAYAVGSLSLRLQIKRKDLLKKQRRSGTALQEWAKDCGKTIREWVHTEFKPSCCHKDIHVTVFRERYTVLITSWTLSTLIILHVIYGTIVLSSIYFIGPRDALQVVGRFMGSVLACRIVCMYEIAGLRENCKEISFECEVPEDRSRYEPANATLEGIAPENGHGGFDAIDRKA